MNMQNCIFVPFGTCWTSLDELLKKKQSKQKRTQFTLCRSCSNISINKKVKIPKNTPKIFFDRF